MSTQTNEKPIEMVEKEQNVHTENSLMKKTKKQLIDIIFRKDDNERRLNKELKNIQLDFEKSKNYNKVLENKIKELNIINESRQTSIDEATIDWSNLKQENTRLKWYIAILVIGVAIVAGISIVF